MSNNSGIDFIDVILGLFILTTSHNQHYKETTTTYRETVDKHGKVIVLKTVVTKERR